MPKVLGRTGNGFIPDGNEVADKPPLLEIGDVGLKRSGGRVMDEFHHSLRTPERRAKTYQEMRDNCAVIGSIFFSAEEFITENGFTITPHKDESPNAIEQADFADSCFGDMEQTRSEFLAEALTMAVHGYALNQKVYKVRGGDSDIPEWRSKYNDRKIGIRKLPTRSQSTIREWSWSEHGDVLAALHQVPLTHERIALNLDDHLHFRTTSNRNNPEGRSWLRNAFRSWYMLKRIQEFEAIGVSKDMAGVPVGRIPEEYMSSNADTNQKATYALVKKVLARAQRGEEAYFLWPGSVRSDGTQTGWDLQPFNSGGRRPMDVDGIIRRYESRILVSVLAEAVLLGMQGNTGSWSLASTKTHGFAMALGGLQRKIADVLNRQLLPELAILNGWPAEWAPTVSFGDLESSDMVADAQAITSLAGAGFITPDDAIETEIRERLGLPQKETISDGQLQDAIGSFDENGGDAAITPEQHATLASQLEAAPGALSGKKLIRTREVAERWSMSPGTVLRMVRNGQIKAYRVGSQIRFDPDDVRAAESGGTPDA